MGILKSRKQNYNEFSENYFGSIAVFFYHPNPRPTNKQSDKKLENNVKLKKGYIGVIQRTFSVLRNQNAELQQNYLKIWQNISIDTLQRIQSITAQTNQLQRISKTQKKKLEIGFDFYMDKIANQGSRCRNVYQISRVLGLTGKDGMGFGW